VESYQLVGAGNKGTIQIDDKTELQEMREKNIAIYGAGGFGREVAWLVDTIASSGKEIKVVCFIDDNPKITGVIINNIEVMSFDLAVKKYPHCSVVSGIGVPKLRERTMTKASGTSLHTTISLIHPATEMSKWVTFGEGAVICAGNILTTNVILGKYVQINLDCTIGHDVMMDDYATLAPGVHISECVTIGKRAYIGTGAVVINGTQEVPIVIGDDAVVGAGACVTRSIPPGETWVGVPAKSIKA
jgi:sugar O-acyltransferase (sialic acid O-acetyltransferase NeuD family)